MTSPAHQVSGGLVQISGPLLDGRAPAILDNYMRANMGLIAKLAEDAVRQELDVVLRNPTGFYRSQISSATRFNRTATHDVVVHDSGVIYGPWLAGTGSRNAPVTRFRGYTHWRKAAQRIEKLARQTTVATLSQLVRKLGG
jgi:hypothetical protein